MARRALLALAALVIAVAIAWTVIGFPGSTTRGREVRLFIRKGSTFREAAESLAAHGVVRSARAFAVYATLRGRDRTTRWGTYVLHDTMSWETILQALRQGRGVVHNVAIPEGFTIAQMAPLLIEALELEPDSLQAAVRDTALLHRLDVPTPTLEGYLFPATYTFPDRITARAVVRTMVERFEQAWKPEWDSILPGLKLNRHDVVTLASIVEREVRREEERLERHTRAPHDRRQDLVHHHQAPFGVDEGGVARKERRVERPRDHGNVERLIGDAVPVSGAVGRGEDDKDHRAQRDGEDAGWLIQRGVREPVRPRSGRRSTAPARRRAAGRP